MTCDGCVKDISQALHKVEGKSHRLCIYTVAKRLVAIPGITKVEANLKDQLIFIEGTAPPSSIVTAIQNTGRDAILRGTGASNSTFSLYWLIRVTFQSLDVS